MTTKSLKEESSKQGNLYFYHRMNKEEQYKRVIAKYVPIEFVDDVVRLILNHPVRFRIVKPRKTKLGDFRAGIGGKRHEITVNGNLNRYTFLITTLHEFAHLHTFEIYGRKVAAHGKEWKNEYRKVLMPIIDSQHLPKDIEGALVNSLVNVKASSCSDQKLSRVLMQYDPHEERLPTLESLEKNSTFALNGRTFVKGKLRRTRYLCTETASNKQYLVSALARVTLVKYEE